MVFNKNAHIFSQKIGENSLKVVIALTAANSFTHLAFDDMYVHM
jgi:hypothetical protein